jgi:hypothetical protein
VYIGCSECTLDVVSVRVVRWCKGGTVRGGYFILCYGEGSETAGNIFEVLNLYCFNLISYFQNKTFVTFN